MLAKHFFAAVLLAIGSSATAKQATVGSPQQSGREAMFAWFHSLELDPILSGKLVSIRYKILEPGIDTRFRSPEYGFVEKDETESGLLLLPSLIERSYKKIPGASWSDSFAVVAPADIKDWLEAQIRNVKKRLTDRSASSFGYTRDSQKCETFVLSRIAALHGFEDLSVQLYQLAEKESFTVYIDEPNEFEERVKYDIGSVLSDEANLSLNRPDQTRSNVLRT